MMEEGGIEEKSESRWVDGSEVDSEQTPWSFEGEEWSAGTVGFWEESSSRRRLWKKPKSLDSLDVDAMVIAGSKGHHKMDPSTWTTVAMAFQTLGVVYGDMGTSPLYVFSDVFSKVAIESEFDVLGALSLVIYTIALIPFAKYVCVVLKANDNGEGGTFALYSLICRYVKLSQLPNQQRADEDISSFRLKLPTPELERALRIKGVLEKNSFFKTILLLMVLMATSMIIGDGILTPSMSVLSAVSGLHGAIAGFNTSFYVDTGQFYFQRFLVSSSQQIFNDLFGNYSRADAIVLLSILILAGLFSIQRFGSGKVGLLFAPVLALWFFGIGSIGLYNVMN